MKKRIVLLVLSLALLIGLLPFGTVFATETDTESEDFQPSQELVDMIKAMEGFSPKPYWDNSQYSVGYGTKPRSEEDLRRYMEEGISEEEAEELLYYHLEMKGISVNRLIRENQLELTQAQYDSLLSFSYNCGAGWTTRDRTIRTAVLEGWTGNDFLFAMGEWCTSAGNVSKGLIRRRMREGNMYLNGIYSMTVPESYSYVQYNPGAGTCAVRVQVYDSSVPARIMAKPTYAGYEFVGWFTQPYSGEEITELGVDTLESWLYAHWRGGDGKDTPQSTENAVTAEPADENCKVLVDTLPVFEQPVKGAAVIGVLNRDRVVHIVAKYTDSNGIVWGQIENDGWINLTVCQSTQEDQQNAVEVVVTTDDVNVRTGPGTDYSVLYRVNTGERLTVTETAYGTGYHWGKITDGWICLQYTNYDDVIRGETTEPTEPEPTEPEPTEPEPTEPEPTEPEPTEPQPTEPQPTEPPVSEGNYPQMGTVTCDRLRIRSGPSTGHQILGYYNTGDRVMILAVEQTGSMAWGKLENGWISMDYVMLDETSEPQPTEPEPTEPEPTQPQPTEPEPTEPEPTEPQPTEPEEEPLTGKVIVQDRLRIRSGPGTDFDIVGYLYGGDAVTITEQTTVGSTVWGKMERGWISMDYVQLDEKPETPEKPVGSAMGVVKTTGMLRVRSGPSTSYPIVGYLNSGTEIKILSQKTIDGTVWGQISEGWVSMDYVEISGDVELPEYPSMTVIATCLRIRSEAGTENTIVGYLYQGDQVAILDTKMVGETRWANVGKGWVSMDYLTE